MYYPCFAVVSPRPGLLLCVALLLAIAVNGQTSDVDPTFNAMRSSALTSTSGLNQIVQPDGKTDVAVFRPSEGGWYVLSSSNGSFVTMVFGLVGDRPIPADYDGDSKADIAVFRPSNGVWYLNQSTSGIGGVQWGLATDVVAPNSFLHKSISQRDMRQFRVAFV